MMGTGKPLPRYRFVIMALNAGNCYFLPCFYFLLQSAGWERASRVVIIAISKIFLNNHVTFLLDYTFLSCFSQRSNRTELYLLPYPRAGSVEMTTTPWSKHKGLYISLRSCPVWPPLPPRHGHNRPATLFPAFLSPCLPYFPFWISKWLVVKQNTWLSTVVHLELSYTMSCFLP